MGRPRSFDWNLAVEMLNDGYTIDGVMRELGCTRNALWSMRRTLGLPIRFKGGPTHIDDERIEWMTREGLSARQIAERLKVNPRTVTRARARLRLRDG